MTSRSKLITAALKSLLSDGPVISTKKTYRYLRNQWRERRDPFKKRFRVSRRLLEQNGLNICFNGSIPEQYDPEAKNVLLAIESPGVVEYEGWLDDDMDFYAEISFANFYDLENYYCPRSLYAGNDNFVNLDMDKKYETKSELVSMVYSESDHLIGHKLRHEVADRFRNEIEIVGSGEGTYTKEYWSDVHQTYLEDKESTLSSHMFNIVIENAKYPEYVSEKFYDCLKTNTVPIYWGGQEGVRKMGFDMDGIIFFDDPDELPAILNDLSASRYEEMRPAVERNRARLLELRQEARFEFILNSVKQHFMHSKNSYHRRQFDNLALDFD